MLPVYLINENSTHLHLTLFTDHSKITLLFQCASQYTIIPRNQSSDQMKVTNDFLERQSNDFLKGRSTTETIKGVYI